jgi:hypothetical protein
MTPREQDDGMSDESRASRRPPVVFLHGKGRAHEPTRVRSCLTFAMQRAGFAVAPADLASLTAPAYTGQLRRRMTAGRPSAPADRRPPPPSGVDVSDRAYQARLDYLATELAVHPYDTWSWLDKVPGALRRTAGEFYAWLYDDVDQYTKQEALRWGCSRAVLANWPHETHVVIVAHSLGTVVALDTLPFLPAHQSIDLITLGSPLGLPRFSGRLAQLRHQFPYEQIRTWVNLREPDDGPASMGPVSDDRRRIAVEHEVDLNGSHDADRYLQHPATGRVLARHLGLAAKAELAAD